MKISNSVSEKLTTHPISNTPALLTKMSSCPKASMVFLTNVAVSDSLIRSAEDVAISVIKSKNQVCESHTLYQERFFLFRFHGDAAISSLLQIV